MTKKILIADDEESLRLLVHATLEDEAHQILEAADGVEALEIARREKPDLILLDVIMPRMDGLEVCRRLKRDPATSHIPIVMLTVMGREEDREKGLLAGADHYLRKPFSPLQLLYLVETLLSEKNARGIREP